MELQRDVRHGPTLLDKHRRHILSHAYVGFAIILNCTC